MKKIETRLTAKASLDLERQVEEELNVPDPEEEKAEALFKDEDTEGNDGATSSWDNRESCL